MLSHFPKKLFEREAKAPAAKHPTDLYQAASDVLGVTLSDALNSRKAKAVRARWGVWLALRDAGWGYKKIGKESTTARDWDHTTIMNAVWSMRKETFDEQSNEWIESARRATVRAMEKRT